MENFIGINRFIIIVRMDSLSAHSSIHSEAIDPFDPNTNGKSANQLGTLALPNGEYNYFTINNDFKLIPILPTFIPENKQFIILLNKEISWPKMGSGLSIVNDRIINYLSNSILRNFLSTVKHASYQNINEGADFELDPLPK